ncbi:MAG: glycosyltransferase family 2 protein [Deltaproteobacteria bacterium]
MPSNIPSAIAGYLRKRAASKIWSIEGHPTGPFSGAIVIPSLAESDNLPQTLHSLALNPSELLSRFMILVVVNHRVDAEDPEKRDNQLTLQLLPAWKRDYGLEHLYWVDAASYECELPAKQGVGLARKIGLDLALQHLDYSGDDPLLVCLDADTIVQPDYLEKIMAHFAEAAEGGASITYRHRPAADAQVQAAIERYELFLRSYVLGLQQAGSPYAFHTVGSAMACRASAYVAAGGMNRRLAGEDFYFLQQVYKVAGVAPLTGTMVHPSPRASARVPFGTGRAVGDMLVRGRDNLLFYHPQLFNILRKWLSCVAGHGGAGGKELLLRAGLIAPELRDYLEKAGFSAAWDSLLRHNPDEKRLMAAFHGWFDAFRTMRMMHHLTDAAYHRVAPEDGVAASLKLAGVDCPADVPAMLEQLRSIQGA